MAGGSVFRVGEDVDIGLMLLNFTALAVGLVLFEKALHVLEHNAEKYPKYHEMINKIYRELMILGLIGLAIKLLKEVKLVNEKSAEMTAFLSADLAVFLMALALIVQAICIYLQLRRKNKEIDVLELFTSEDLYLLASSHERHRKVNRNPIMKIWTANKYEDLMSMRLMRYLFLRTHELPELFPFAKYLRQAQDNQITHMIDVEPTTWFIVFLVAWMWYSGVGLLANSGWVGSVADDDRRRLADKKTTATQNKTLRAALAVVFLLFVWILVFAHMATAMYLQWCRQRILNYAGIASRSDMMKRLREIFIEESSHLNSEVTGDALKKMQQVENDLQLARHKRHQHDHNHGHHDPGYLFLKSCLKATFQGGKHSLKHHAESPKRARLRTRATPGADGTGAGHPAFVALELPYFSRRGWHFFIMLNLILNGLYAAFFLQIMMFHMADFVADFGWLPALMIPTPILLNIFVQTQIIRDFVLVSSIWRVDVVTLSDVIDHFTEILELQTTFISEIHQCLEQQGTSIEELSELLIVNDINRSGWVDVEDFRQILMAIGFSMSFFKFNSVMKLLFNLRQLKVDYRKVITLISLAEEHHRAAPEAAIVGHEDIPMLEYKLSMCASSTVMMPPRPSDDGTVNHFERSTTTAGPTPHLEHAVRPTLQDALSKNSKYTQQLMMVSNLHLRASVGRHLLDGPLSTRSAGYSHSLTSEGTQPGGSSRGGRTMGENGHWGMTSMLPTLSTTSEVEEVGSQKSSSQYVRI